MSDWLDSELPRVAKSIEVGPAPVWLADSVPSPRRNVRALVIAGAMLVVGLAGGSSVVMTQLAGTHPTPNATPASTTPTPDESPTPLALTTATPTPSPSESPGSSNHGSVVSAAAHSCPHGAGGVHGKCVSAVAQSNAGKPGATPTPAPTP